MGLGGGRGGADRNRVFSLLGLWRRHWLGNHVVGAAPHTPMRLTPNNNYTQIIMVLGHYVLQLIL